MMDTSWTTGFCHPVQKSWWLKILKHPIELVAWKKSIPLFAVMGLSKMVKIAIVVPFCNVLQPDLVVDHRVVQNHANFSNMILAWNKNIVFYEIFFNFYYIFGSLEFFSLLIYNIMAHFYEYINAIIPFFTSNSNILVRVV